MFKPWYNEVLFEAVAQTAKRKSLNDSDVLLLLDLTPMLRISPAADFVTALSTSQRTNCVVIKHVIFPRSAYKSLFGQSSRLLLAFMVLDDGDDRRENEWGKSGFITITSVIVILNMHNPKCSNIVQPHCFITLTRSFVNTLFRNKRRGKHLSVKPKLTMKRFSFQSFKSNIKRLSWAISEGPVCLRLF